MDWKLIHTLKQNLLHPLPGTASHNKLTPLASENRVLELSKTTNPRLSAVLIIIYPKSERWHFALMQRPDYNGAHAKQISLPGGKHEPQDLNLQETALRETFEEFGIDISSEQVITSLTKVFIPISKFLISPYIALLKKKPRFSPNPKEVEQIYEIPLQELTSPSSMTQEKITLQKGVKYQVPAFRLQGKTVWGATAMILSEFKDLLSLQ